MKKSIVFALISVVISCIPMEGKYRIVNENDSQGNLKRIIELNDTVINGKTVTDTLSITTYVNSLPADRKSSSVLRSEYLDYDDEHVLSEIAEIMRALFLPSILVIGIFVLPFIILIFILCLIYKNSKAKYKIIEQAIAKGYPLPSNKCDILKIKDSRTKGFKNLFLGLGLFIFIWAFLGFSIACVGLLIAFIGLGQLAIYYTRPKSNDRKEEYGCTRQTPEEKEGTGQSHNNSDE